MTFDLNGNCGPDNRTFAAFSAATIVVLLAAANMLVIAFAGFDDVAY